MFRANQSDVPDIAVGAIGDLSRRCEGRERDRDLEPRAERTRDARRETRRRAGFVAPGNEQGVAQIDRRAQNPERRKAATRDRTLGISVDLYLSSRKSLSPRSIEEYRRSVTRHLEAWLDRPLRETNEWELRASRREYESEPA